MRSRADVVRASGRRVDGAAVRSHRARVNYPIHTFWMQRRKAHYDQQSRDNFVWIIFCCWCSIKAWGNHHSNNIHHVLCRTRMTVETSSMFQFEMPLKPFDLFANRNGWWWMIHTRRYRWFCFIIAAGTRGSRPLFITTSRRTIWTALKSV